MKPNHDLVKVKIKFYAEIEETIEIDSALFTELEKEPMLKKWDGSLQILGYVNLLKLKTARVKEVKFEKVALLPDPKILEEPPATMEAKKKSIEFRDIARRRGFKIVTQGSNGVSNISKNTLDAASLKKFSREEFESMSEKSFYKILDEIKN